MSLYETLGFDHILNRLSKHCFSELGRSLIVNHEKFQAPDRLAEELLLVEDFRQLSIFGHSFPSTGYQQINQYFHRLSIEHYTLEEQAFIDIRKLLHLTAAVRKFLEAHEEFYPNMLGYFIHANIPLDLYKRINQVFDQEDEIREDASALLLKLSKEKGKLKQAIFRSFNNVLKHAKEADWLADTQESIRNGRRVLSVRVEHKRKIDGVLHEQSESGRTAYIEPYESIALQNQLVELEADIRKEVLRILKELTGFTKQYLIELGQLEKLAARADLLQAKGKLAFEMDAKRVQLSQELQIELYKAYHPILYVQHKAQQEPTVPQQIKLDQKNRILIISGPNAGGKTICLKMLGLFQLMLQYGLLIPADERSKISLFTAIYTDIGDTQSVENELSTYSAHLLNMKKIIQKIDEQSLVLLDEFGTGTDPQFGGAMAASFISEIVKKKAFCIISTHYSELKNLANEFDCIVNAKMKFDTEKLSPLYELEQGTPGSSYTFEMARKLGVDRDLIEYAKRLSDSAKVNTEKLLVKLEKEKAKLEADNILLKNEDLRLKEMLSNLNRMNKEVEQQKQELKYDLKLKKQELMAKMETEVRHLIQDLKKEEKTMAKAQQKLQKLRDERKPLDTAIKDMQEKRKKHRLDTPVAIGTRVRIGESEQEGVVEAIKRNKATVVFGSIKAQIAISELEVIADKIKQKVVRKHPNKNYRKPTDLALSVDIRGMRKDEAQRTLEQYLDQALLENVAFVKIIHGRGTGVLKQLVNKMLKQYPSIASHEYEAADAGGDGATIVKFYS